jgi:hypothetical protein
MVGIDVPGERRQRPVGHADGDRRHVFERVRHREQQDVHRRAPTFVGPPTTLNLGSGRAPETLAWWPSRMCISRRAAQRDVRRLKSEVPQSTRKGPRVRIRLPQAESRANFRYLSGRAPSAAPTHQRWVHAVLSRPMRDRRSRGPLRRPDGRAERRLALQGIHRPFDLGRCRHSIHSTCFLCQSSMRRAGRTRVRAGRPRPGDQDRRLPWRIRRR